MRGDITPKQFANFWTRVDRSSGPDACWEFNGHRNHAGYGVVNCGVGRKGRHAVLAHRLAFIDTFGPLPPGKPFVLHSCDHPPCCNPAHLRAGTKKDNAADRLVRGRDGDHKGVANGRSKLTDEIVAEILARYTGARGQRAQLAREFGVTAPMIGHIISGRNWTHLKPSLSEPCGRK
jgi:hypothetical protein